MKEEPPTNEEPPPSKLFSDVVNVSEGFQLRTAYKKKVKPSKLDGLLERRVKQFTLEEKQRLERMRQSALLNKMAATKANSAVKTEGGKQQQQPVVASCVKAEEQEQSLQANVVKTLDEDIKSESTTTNHGSEADAGDAVEAVNGGHVSGSQHATKNNCISDAIETKERPQKPEITRLGESVKKRSYEEMEQGHADAVEQNQASPVQVNGQTPADANISPELSSKDQADTRESHKELLKSLMNGNLSENNGSGICHPPPLKVSRLENHVVEEGDVAGNSEEPVKPPSSSPSWINSNSSSDGLKANSTSTESSKPDASSQPGAVSPQRPKPPGPSMTISKDYSTRGRVSLLRFCKSKKARSGTALPSYRKFVTKSSKKSIFILPNDDLKRLARRAGIREVPIFNYSAKPAQDIWPYPSPRPTFSITWRWAPAFVSGSMLW